MAPGELSLREYDYLLNMPVMSLTDEKVDELDRQLKEKKAEYDKLFAMHIFELWENDLDNFLIALEKQNELEEKDRNAYGASNGGSGKRKGGKKGTTAGGGKDKENGKTARGQGNAGGGRGGRKPNNDASHSRKPQTKQEP